MSLSKERELRRRLKKEGYILKKSRIRTINADNFGEYMIIDGRINGIVGGSRFDYSLEDVEQFLNRWGA